MRFLHGLVPQWNAVALSLVGLGNLLGAWQRLGHIRPSPLPTILPLTGLAVLLLYCVKMVVVPGAFYQDMWSTKALPSISAISTSALLLVARYSVVSTMPISQAMIIVAYVAGTTVALHFMRLSYKEGVLPDPTWFPAIAGPCMTLVATGTTGPEWLRRTVMPSHYAASVVLVLGIVLPTVLYRLFYSKARESVAPNATMAGLMAPSSFLCVVQLGGGEPLGREFSYFIFACSTAFLFCTVLMLFRRRSLWMQAFNWSYATFTFPSGTTATAAMLASEKLPFYGFSWLVRCWAAFLTSVASIVILTVAFKFLLATIRLCYGGKGEVVDAKIPVNGRIAPGEKKKKQKQRQNQSAKRESIRKRPPGSEKNKQT
eukprot:TRINITY_DN61203_c0_g1_i1.p1 TRINITY_DN61203_c0_g1~~TRINITY_DN61203_c0_g1_i1.p1  ORF type:complete len:372 (+),score=36.03 TRINITY_DN61203_c0_g1_i1:80-1195(+)